ncbi:TIGR03560 family F420-dependent LLM class oxidoreductase [Ktedonosporobacter rubrisoli]|uniref:TIGR03560 family F420-dependent LLM class oxidoreductase n=1 Tax=Ktedonosporobacter rubrisoli TaxID=2509675 RepID=A0A4P6K015_KTERU|nr:TIGR03560 family F420-dependent LLM class oxidoreductase [Ktedonosporobacter rubrisoli]QBD81364.1 TIGR03560 family F420-dependent LLM class oxidoreductase [Ktedonosporobacter rubrisoli]
MIALSIMIEGQNGLTWPRWKRLVQEVEELGFAGLFRSDHYTNPEPPDIESLEMIVSLAYLADHTQHLHFGPLVAPISFREPTLLARQAAALDDLSDGRMILGLGAGWQVREHQLFGHKLGDVQTRMHRLEEGIEVVTHLLHSDEPVTFDGKFFQLRGATLLPRPQRSGGPRILIGGNGPKRTLPLAARYADIWNAVSLNPQTFRERSAILDDLIRIVGRKPQDIKRTLMTSLFFGRDMNELDQRLSWRQQRPDLAGKPLDEALKILRETGNIVVGTPDMILEQITNFAKAGVEELMLQWFDLDDIDGLRAFANSVLKRL